MSSNLHPDSKPYESQSLDHTKQQIRLLSILPSSTNDDKIRCAIQTFDLKQAPPFTALSYVWGPPDPRHGIYIDGGVLEVRGNLYNFLYEFRKQEEKENSDEYLWIDQTCINQIDLKERSYQVGIMSEIYKGAESVIVWLGDGIHHRNGHAEYMSVQICKETGDTHALWGLARNGYFDRLWIVQEFLLATRVRILVKNLWVDEQDLLLLNDPFPALCGSIKHGPFSSLLLHRRQQNEPQPGPRRSIVDVLDPFFRQSCEDPRDKVYGLMGLIDEEERVGIDYTRSIHQVFMDLVLVTSAGCSEQIIWDREMCNKKFTQFYDIMYHMPFTKSQKIGIHILLVLIWRPESLGRFNHLPCPIDAMGFEPADETTRVDSWWFNFLDTRYDIECTEDWFHGINAATTRLYCEDWAKYRPEIESVESPH
jgi:hypothetical protein